MLVLGLVATAGVAWQVRQNAWASDALRFENLALQVEGRIRARVSAQGAALIGTAALVAFDPGLSEVAFRRHVQRLRVYAGIDPLKDVGFARRRPGQPTTTATAVDEFPVGPHERPTTIPHGVDLGADPVRAAAMSRARDTGAPAASAMLRPDDPVAPGATFLLLVPVYRGPMDPQTVEQRREQLVGFVYSAFDAGALLSGIAREEPTATALSFALFDGDGADPHRQLFASAAPRGHVPAHQLVRRIDAAGEPWTVAFSSLPSFESAWRPRATTLLPLLCLAVTLALFAFTRFQVVARRDAERSNEELRQAREEALRHLHTRDSFLSVASHELKTPLTALQLHADGLLRAFESTTRGRMTFEPERVRGRLETVARQARKLGQLIDELLDVSRASQGQLPVHPEQFDLCGLIREIRSRFQPAMARARCRARVSCEKGLVGCWDRLRVDQVLTNLLSNAIKYGPGSPIEISARRQGDGVVITVRDHGIGIDPKDQLRIFERFERAVPERQFGGFGVGLWISREIVRTLGGDIRVNSEPGKGALFQVTLPLTIHKDAVSATG